MKNILIDAGPLIALFDKSDKYNESIINFYMARYFRSCSYVKF